MKSATRTKCSSADSQKRRPSRPFAHTLKRKFFAAPPRFEFGFSYGEVKDVVVKTDPSTGTSRGFGFVMFTAEESIGKVLAAGPHNLDGKRIDPKKAERRDGKMFVGGVKSDTTVETIKEYFSQFGEVESVDRPVNKQTNENKPFCFVIFKKDGVNSKCIKRKRADPQFSFSKLFKKGTTRLTENAASVRKASQKKEWRRWDSFTVVRPRA